MIPRALIGTAGFIAFGLIAASPANAQVDYWTGPYIGPTYGQDFGTAHYYFVDAGYFNPNPGDTHDQPLYGLPMGFVTGHNWRNDNLLYGIEAQFYSHTTKAANSCLRLSDYTPMGQWGDCGDVSPFDPTQQWDFKGHWFVSFSARVGYVHNRLLFYAQAGPVLGHVVSRMNDFDEATGQYLWVPGRGSAFRARPVSKSRSARAGRSASASARPTSTRFAWRARHSTTPTIPNRETPPTTGSSTRRTRWSHA